MKPLHFLLVLPLALAGFVLAETRPPLEDESVRQLKADLPLIEALVDEAIQIAGEDNPGKRIERCEQLAKRFAKEFDAADKDHFRQAELAQHLAQLSSGVARNVERATLEMKENSLSSKEVLDFGQKFIQAIAPVENQLKKTADVQEDPATKTAMKSANDAMQQGRNEIENAVKGKGKSKEKGNSHGKGKKGKQR